jgi:hypothetical protein
LNLEDKDTTSFFMNQKDFCLEEEQNDFLKLLENFSIQKINEIFIKMIDYDARVDPSDISFSLKGKESKSK